MSQYLISTVTSITLSAVVFTMLCESDQYLAKLDATLAEEKSAFFGGNLKLSLKELQVDQILCRAKEEELEAAYKDSSRFLPSMHFFQAKEKIDQSEVFAIIRKAPKGASLHTHLTAAVSVDFLIRNFTYREHLYGGYVNDVFKLKFMTNPEQDDRCNWTSLKEMREKQSAEVVDEELRKKLMLNVDRPKEAFKSLEAVWKQFKRIFTTTYEMYSYRPVFEEFIYQLLQELHDDNVMYTELKGTILPLYELNGTVYSNQQFFEIFIRTVNKFKKDHPRFIGVKYIHSIYRGVDKETLKEGLKEILELKKQFPDFIAGFDFVGFEEEGRLLVDFHSEILEAQKELNFFSHAGETSWFGHTDLNLACAILLNSSRIGHGFAITKHPRLLRLAQDRKIPLELCPISNQVLMLNEDPRNHPATHLLAIDYPLVVCNDDPSAWNATGLSYDWYITFMAMTPKKSGLEVLKKFAINSILYSDASEEVKEKMMKDWEKQWDEFLDLVLISNNKNLDAKLDGSI